MATIVNDNKLNLILTTHGKNRIAQALADSSVNIEITKIKIGSGNNNEYYVPSETQTELMGPLGIEFPVVEKALLEDGLTISFLSVISENAGGFDIREVGLYENYNGVDTLFAISTQQPFVKPSIDYSYLISMNYYMFLKAANISSVYDQIVLTAENVVVTEPDLEDMMNTVLFAHANLIDQIQKNSTIIGYNRPTQLLSLINSNLTNFSYLTTYKNYSAVTNYIDPKQILAYWVFDYSRHNAQSNSIPDISDNRTNLTVTTSAAKLKREYTGFAPYFNIEGSDYFSLNTDVPFSLLNDLQTADSSFSMLFILRPNNFNNKRTLLARSNAALSNSKVFEVFELGDGSVQVILCADNSNYITFTSAPNIIPEAGFHSVIINYKHLNKEMSCYIGGQEYLMTKVETGTYNHMNTALSTIYCFKCAPTYTIYANGNTEVAPTALYNADGTSYIGTDWAIINSEGTTIVRYKSNEAEYDSTQSINSPTYYAWTYDSDIYTYTVYTTTDIIEEDTPLYLIDGNNIVVAPEDSGFSIVSSGSDFIIQYNGHNTQRNSSADVPPKTLYAWRYTEAEHYIFTNNGQYPTLLFNENGTPYTGTIWSIRDNVVYFYDNIATYNPYKNKTLSVLEVGSYITDENGQKIFPIDSKVSLVAACKNELTNSQARVLSLLLESTLGKNPCIDGGI